jgi:predicted  nucleic acid-binding Zn-ribbon protein
MCFILNLKSAFAEGFSRSHSQSLSLSQEFASGRSPQRLMPDNGLRHQRSESLLTGIRPYGASQNNPLYTPTRDRSVDSLEQEIMRLQEVIREREAEIAVLEKSPSKLPESEDPQSKDTQSLNAELSELRDSLAQDLVDGNQNGNGLEKRSSIGRLNELMR